MPTTGPTAQNNPDAFVGKVTLSAYEPYGAMTGSAFSSLTPAQAAVVHWVQPNPLIARNMWVVNSLAAGVPTATGQASTGSEAFSYGLTAYLYGRQDYTSNSSVLSHLTSGSFGLTANLGYSSTSQTFGMSWATDTTGGTSNLSTTSSDAAWSNYANGPRAIAIPFVATLTAGEYWMMFQQASTSATSNSNVTLLSMSQLQFAGQQGNAVVGAIGQSTTNYTVPGPVWNIGILIGTPTTSTTMALSAIGAGVRPIWFALSNA